MSGNTKKLKIGVLMGGPSAEHEVSLATGQAMLANLARRKYLARPIIISKKSQWLVGGKPKTPTLALRGIDAALLGFHGEFGEDGRMQAFLEHHNLPYTGSGVGASALGLDKLKSRLIFSGGGLFAPRTLNFSAGDFRGDAGRIYKKVRNVFGKNPVVVKPQSRGSSVGVSIARSPKEIKKAFRAALRFENKILVEEYLPGTEVTAAILERRIGAPEALPLVEIRPRKSAFFDYREKYGGDKGAEEIVPARVSKKDAGRIVGTGLAAYQLLGCRGYARVDFILSRGRPYVLEVNTLPGMTPVSLFPKAAGAAGVDFSELLDILIINALRQQDGGAGEWLS